ncbi:MAG TPA: TonB-dependent receptor [Gallionellaceae bacterium]
MQRYAITLAVLCTPLLAQAATDADLQSLREQVRQLEQRVQDIESQPAPAPATAPSGSNAFNPDISLILAGTYGRLGEDPSVPATGFAMSPNNSGYSRSFSLKESELGISASIDPQFRGFATIALAPEGGSSVENAFVQTTALGNGLNLKMGRYFSGLGYLNEQHAHAWDFMDQPLVYRTLWDNQLGEDGVQLKWLAPTDTFVELGAELGRGRGYPGTDNADSNGAGSQVLFAHVGDDIGVSSSWRAGVSLHQTHRVNAVSNNVPDLPGTAGGTSNSFSGDSRTAGLDFVWKYAPDGNATVTNFKLQAEYFQRTEDGMLTYNSTTTDSYRITQSGWYVQGVYQFMPRWRVGLRYDQLNAGNAEVGALLSGSVISDYYYTPTRNTLMFDFSPSEFSRLHLQLAQDRSREGLTDNQLFVQYIMSMGAHGAHQF